LADAAKAFFKVPPIPDCFPENGTYKTKKTFLVDDGVCPQCLLFERTSSCSETAQEGDRI